MATEQDIPQPAAMTTSSPSSIEKLGFLRSRQPRINRKSPCETAETFPNGRHDDQVDSVSQFLRWLQDAYLNQISFHVPFVVSWPMEFPP